MEQIDILMATYNGEKYLREQIESILNQTYKNIRLIISDDCSTDQTREIIKQYEKREKLFKNPEVLPEFDLLTYKPVQGIGRAKNKLKYKTWFEALAKMKEDIKNIDFDVALIGAGAYGIFLAQFVKSLGRQAIHGGRGDATPLWNKGFQVGSYA